LGVGTKRSGSDERGHDDGYRYPMPPCGSLSQWKSGRTSAPRVPLADKPRL
jgi:hypothetical protein